MPASDGVEEPPAALHELLGIARDASPDEVEGAYWRLRAHIEARARESRDASFVAARQAELDRLDVAARREARHPGATPTRRHRASEPRRAACATRRRDLPARTAVWGAGVAVGALTAFLWLSADSTGSPVGPDPAAISVRARPEGAALEILDAEDERVVRRGPADGSRQQLEPGDYVLRVGRADCPDEWIRPVQLEPGDDREFAPRICQGSGSLVVRSNVSGDRVKIDGLDVGSTGASAHPLSVGDHDVRVEKQGFEPWLGKVRIRPDEDLTLQAELDRASSPSNARSPSRSTPPDPPRRRAATPSPQPARPPAIAHPPSGEPQQFAESRRSGASAPVRTGLGGSKSWHDAVRDRLLAQYDGNRSGSLDNPAEINAIPCAEWRSIESSYETGGLSVPMTRLYGFDGSEAPSNTLGVTRAMRGYAYDRMTQCGLRAAS